MVKSVSGGWGSSCGEEAWVRLGDCSVGRVPSGVGRVTFVSADGDFSVVQMQDGA